MAQRNGSKTVHLVGVYFKLGDDHAGLQQEALSPQEVFLDHARMLKEGARVMERIADILDEAPAGSVTVDADTHLVSITLPSNLADRLLEEEMVHAPEEEKEDKEDEEEGWDVEDEWDEAEGEGNEGAW